MNLRSLLLSCSCCVATSLVGCRTTAGSTVAVDRTPAPAEAPAADRPAAAVQPPERPIALGLRVEALTRDGQQRLLDSDETLRSGDKLAMHVNVGEAAHVYVGLTSSIGNSVLLFPQAGSADEPLAPAVDHRFPKAGWFKLDKAVGQEDLFVYASRFALTTEQTLELIKQDTARARPRIGRASKKPPASAPSPPLASPDEGPGELRYDRGLKVVPEDGVEVQEDPNLSRAHFLIKHTK